MCQVFESHNNLLHLALGQFVGSRHWQTLRSTDELGFRSNSPVLVFIPNPAKSAISDLVRAGYSYSHHFVMLPSRDKPRWLLPLGNTCWTLGGTRVYAPYALSARAMKLLFNRIIALGWSGRPFYRVMVASKERLPIEALVAEITGERHPVFALSLGNQSAVRKLTVQVMRPAGDVLGYIRLPLTPAAVQRVRNEATALQHLEQFPALRPHVPRLLHAGPWREGYLLFESALLGELGPKKLTRVHDDFLRALQAAYVVERSAQSLVEQVGAKWEKVVPLLGAEWKDLGHEALRRAAQGWHRPIVCGIGHGDFAPWNTRMREGRLLLFDWESAEWDVPTSWDIFHFGLQTAVSFHESITCGQIPWCGGALYLLYLLNSVLQFHQEQNHAAIADRGQLLHRAMHATIRLAADARGKWEVPQPTIEKGRSRTPALILYDKDKPTIVTTSWDDGDPRDLKLAELLRSRGLRGTFYIPMSGYLGNPTLGPSCLRALASDGFEIGAHSVSHMSLTLFTGEQLRREVSFCKRELEQRIGREVTMFCYPNGRFNQEVLRQVERAGYKGARTTRMLHVKLDFVPFEMPTTVQAFPHQRENYVRDLARARNYLGFVRRAAQLTRFASWVELGKELFDHALEQGGVWHLYGHSWEVDQFGVWADLQEILDYVSHRSGVTYTTNGELVRFLECQDRSARGKEAMTGEKDVMTGEKDVRFAMARCQ